MPHPASRCRCPDCFSLAEFMAETTGRDYGLSPSPGCARTHKAQGAQVRDIEPERGMTDLDPAELARLQERARSRARQPWDLAA